MKKKKKPKTEFLHTTEWLKLPYLTVASTPQTALHIKQ